MNRIRTPMATHRRLQMAVSLMLLLASSAHAQVQRIWLPHRTHDPNKIVVNWTTEEPRSSVVR